MKKNAIKKILSTKNQIRTAFIVGVAIILLIALLLVAILEYALIIVEPFTKFNLDDTPLLWVLAFALISIIIGICLTLILEKFILKPFNYLLDGMDKLSEGDFSTRIDLGKVMGMKNLSDKFNSLAMELENLEILRSDFVNDFSHELKTPIVSIRSLISLMKTGDIPKEKQIHYLTIIEEEIDRLTEMTTNILNLNKVENQGILTDKRRFNLSEQIRTCMVLLEKKWTKKNLTPDIDFDEYEIIANEDMLKQVWLNLIDNAIKFADENTALKISVTKDGGKLAVAVQNVGETINPTDYGKIFQKFYQSSSSEKKNGNGIGLSIVKHIVDLHGGEILVESKHRLTTFTVILDGVETVG